MRTVRLARCTGVVYGDIREFFFPVPPDLVLIPLALTPVYAAVTTAGSVPAGLVGFHLRRNGGRSILKSRFPDERVQCAEAYFDYSGFATITLRAFAPIPEGYELLSVTPGVLGADTRTYIRASLLRQRG